MKPRISVQALDPVEVRQIHDSALALLAKTGVAVEHPEIRSLLATHGAVVDESSARVRFPAQRVVEFLDRARDCAIGGRDLFPIGPNATRSVRRCYRPLCSSDEPSVSARSGVSHGFYLEPETNRALPFTEETLAGYIKLARELDNGIDVSLVSYPVGEGRPTQPLEARLFAWRHGAIEAGSIQLTELCPYLLEMCEIRALALGLTLADVFCGSVYLISPLRLAAPDAEQIMFFRRHGLLVRLGNMFTAGGTGPSTLAGCLVLNLAESIAIGLIHWALFGQVRWVIFGEMAPMDMRRMVLLQGRPESLLLNLAVIQLARHYGVPAQTWGGGTQATLPSAQAAAQKLLTALPAILAGGCNIDAGRLTDTLYSPIQMILDSEMISTLRRVVRGFEVTEETLAVELMDQIGPGGLFLSTEHTVKNWRREFWQPRLWQAPPRGDWDVSRSSMDTDAALDLWRHLMSKPETAPGIDEDTERRLKAVVSRAAQALS